MESRLKNIRGFFVAPLLRGGSRALWGKFAFCGGSLHFVLALLGQEVKTQLYPGQKVCNHLFCVGGILGQW
jgi:hypothetical protein